MSDLLKEAIADAKAVRETALLNAKAALEEAFTPQLKSMLSAKLKEDEFEDEEDDIAIDDEGGDDEVEEIGPLGAAAIGALGAKMTDQDEDEDDEIPDDIPAEEGEFGDEEIPADGEEEDEEEDEEEIEDNLDLEAVIKELEQEISEDEDEDEDEEPVEEASTEEPVKETEDSVDEEFDLDEEVFEEDEELDEETDQSSGVGSGTGSGSTDKSSGIGTGGQEKAKAMESVTAELAEYKEAVSFLKDKLHEVNILNAKLLYTNKLFKEFSLDNNQKLKVVETFDRAQTTREIKLVYATIAEQLNENSSVIKRKSIKESASAPVGSTKPSKEATKVISEESEVANRFKKLAGLLKD